MVVEGGLLDRSKLQQEALMGHLCKTGALTVCLVDHLVYWTRVEAPREQKKTGVVAGEQVAPDFVW